MKAAFRRLLRDAGGQSEAAAATRVGQQALSRYGSPHHETDHVPADVLMDLTMDADNPEVIRTLCRLAGGVFVPLPATRRNDACWPQELGAMVRSGAEAAESICKALSDDGRISLEEIQDLDIRNKLSAAIEALAVLDGHARQVEGVE
ncbi:phage regulatory CII family protein [Roseibium salinum]|uniref:phage regulatory CII family protein n=1 Tax=Roseibium salinum TaxID=1604349 RepID=UPI0036167E34